MSALVRQEAIDLIKHFEGFRSTPYQCSAKVWTIGYGSTYTSDGARVTQDTPLIDKAKAEQWLMITLQKYALAVHKLITVPLNPFQHGALVSFTYNVGTGNLQASTLRAKLNRGDYKGAAGEFPKWRRAAGQILPGLVKRRAAEKELFIKEYNNEHARY